MSRIVTYLTKFKNLVSTSPVLFSDQNTEVNQIYQNFNDLDAGTAKLAGESTQDFSSNDLNVYGEALFSGGGLINPRGTIQGNLVFNTAALPPKIGAGVYEVNGKNIEFDADTALALADAFGNSDQAFDTYAWTFILLDNAGNKKWCLAYDNEPVGSLTDISLVDQGGYTISVASGVATVYTSNTTGLAAGHIALIPDSQIISKVISVSAGVSFTVNCSLADGNYNPSTYSAKFRAANYHGPGTKTGHNTDADIEKYSPLIPSEDYNKVKKGYYLNANGEIVTDSTGVYRILGCGLLDSSGNMTDIISYKSGKNKNDNDMRADTHNGYGSPDNKITRFLNYRRLRGHDYTAIDTASTGLKIQINTEGYFDINWYHATNSGNVQYGGLTLNGTTNSTSFQSIAISEKLSLHGCDNFGTNFSGIVGSVNQKFYNGDIIRTHTNGIAPNSNESLVRLSARI